MPQIFERDFNFVFAQLHVQLSQSIRADEENIAAILLSYETFLSLKRGIF
jgi:hypothetical protein